MQSALKMYDWLLSSVAGTPFVDWGLFCHPHLLDQSKFPEKRIPRTEKESRAVGDVA